MPPLCLSSYLYFHLFFSPSLSLQGLRPSERKSEPATLTSEWASGWEGIEQDRTGQDRTFEDNPSRGRRKHICILRLPFPYLWHWHCWSVLALSTVRNRNVSTPGLFGFVNFTFMTQSVFWQSDRIGYLHVTFPSVIFSTRNCTVHDRIWWDWTRRCISWREISLYLSLRGRFHYLFSLALSITDNVIWMRLKVFKPPYLFRLLPGRTVRKVEHKSPLKRSGLQIFHSRSWESRIGQTNFSHPQSLLSICLLHSDRIAQGWSLNVIYLEPVHTLWDLLRWHIISAKC